MRFDGNLAWQQAVRLFSTNKELLLVLAGVFFFLPGVASALFLGDMQTQVMRDISTVDSHDTRAMMAAMGAMYGKMGPYVAAMVLVQTVGTMAMMALLTDAARPTVGQAIAMGIARLPTLLGVLALMLLGYLVSAAVFGVAIMLIAAAASAASGTAGAGVAIAMGMGLFVAFMLVALTRLSVTLPVIMIDQMRHPLRAMRRSWALTRGSTAPLLGFYLMLFVAYMVIALVLYMVATAPISLITDKGSTGFYTASGIVSGLIGGAASALGTTILCAVHGQLGGAGRETLSETFR